MWSTHFCAVSTEPAKMDSYLVLTTFTYTKKTEYSGFDLTENQEHTVFLYIVLTRFNYIVLTCITCWHVHTFVVVWVPFGSLKKNLSCMSLHVITTTLSLFVTEKRLRICIAICTLSPTISNIRQYPVSSIGHLYQISIRLETLRATLIMFMGVNYNNRCSY
jgi:hypothetical protein